MPDKPEPAEELVKVFDTEQESEAMVVQGLLQSAGIDAYVQSLDATQNIYPGVGGVIVVVRIRLFFRSFATDSAKPITPHFDAQ